MNKLELKVLDRELEARKARAKADEKLAESDSQVANVIDDFLAQCDDPTYFRTVYDKLTGRKIVLSDQDVDLISRIRKACYPDPNYDPYEPYVDFFSHEVSIHPVMNRPEPKAAFIPSLSEKRALTKLVALITSGKLKPYKPKKKTRTPFDFNFDLWSTDGDLNHRRHRAHIPAPKMILPGHAESYNPPPEYLLTKDDIKKWQSQSEEDREHFFLPQRYASLRQVPFYQNTVKERFERCLELYMCPRQRIRRAKVDPEDLIPKLPRPRDLAPFPTTESIVYRGHDDLVRSIAVEPQGQFLASACDDCTVKIWEIINGRCWRTIKFNEPVTQVTWCPNARVSILSITVGKIVYIANTLVADYALADDTEEFFASTKTKDHNDEADEQLDADSGSDGEQEQTKEKHKKHQPIQWIPVTPDTDNDLYEAGIRLKLILPTECEQFVWHPRGDYFSVVMPTARNLSVIIAQLGRHESKYPFRRGGHLFLRVAFHPKKPYLLAADDRTVFIYDLFKKQLVKKLVTGFKNTSCITVHSGGDNVLVGSYEPKLAWFDTDFSQKPYKTMRYHKGAIRAACYHRRYPLFASGSDDSHVIVSHGMVYDDLSENALIVPLKVLHGHEHAHTHAVADCQFHHSLPWIFSCGADKTIRLFT